mmetsp:Transcript_33884/g.52792  ORF Transcript_33884/g.52792 Transcript_33884/m.52792 type:complete len:81 (+) Transcript_33884:1251-1493(+)
MFRLPSLKFERYKRSDEQVSLFHCMPVGLLNSGAGLGMMWGRSAAKDMLLANGFNKVDPGLVACSACHPHNQGVCSCCVG